MTSLKETFTKAKSENRAVLIAYLPAGFPSLDGSIQIINEMFKNGVDVIEVGVPYSDPLMDGPVIQEAVDIALNHKTGIKEVMHVVKKVSENNKPVLTMSYWSPIEKWGIKKYVEEFKNSGGNGVITPDLPPDESDEWIDETDKQHVDRIFVVAPSTSEERLKLVSSKVTGFVYAASLMGVTGTRNQISQSAETLVTRLRKVTDLPVAVGLGVSTPEQAKQVAKYADGVIVGSAFIKLILQTKDLSKSVGAIGQLAKDLARSMHRN
ncbi:MAG: tryptophan synthase subunit alpha [Actinomycetes bacterium]|jgi:tryptophan synthase alpha chain